MTEKFMKLSDFLKLIKREDEQENAGAARSAGGAPGGAPPEAASDRAGERFDFSKAFAAFGGGTSDKARVGGGASPSQAEEEEAAGKKKEISDDELAAILSYFGWKAPEKALPPKQKQDLPPGKPEKPEKREKRSGLFDGLDGAVISEIFTREELEQLRREETHVFTEDDVRTLNGKSPPKTRKRAELKAPAAEGADEYGEAFEEDGAYSPISRRRAYRTGCFGGILYFGFVVCVSLALCAFAWKAADDVLSLSKAPVTAEIYVGEEKDMNQVASELKSKGIIEYKWLFKLYAKISEAADKIEPGIYTVSSQLDYRAIITKLRQDSGWSGEARETVSVLIPEGKTLVQTFQILSDAGVCAYETLLDCAENYDFKYDFLEEVGGGVQYRLEGYLFPDTYEFYLESKPEEAISKLLDNYKAKITDEMKAQAQALGYSMNEIITIASLIEMEAGSDDERATIASVIYNRLKSGYYPYLQIDATVQYALGERKERLSYEDRLVESDYNTYLREGLPPGPIANPGLASIKAALNPVTTDYYFYALNKQGTHAFFSDIDSFNVFLNSDQFGG